MDSNNKMLWYVMLCHCHGYGYGYYYGHCYRCHCRCYVMVVVTVVSLLLLSLSSLSLLLVLLVLLWLLLLLSFCYGYGYGYCYGHCYGCCTVMLLALTCIIILLWMHIAVVIRSTAMYRCSTPKASSFLNSAIHLQSKLLPFGVCFASAADSVRDQ